MGAAPEWSVRPSQVPAMRGGNGSYDANSILRFFRTRPCSICSSRKTLNSSGRRRAEAILSKQASPAWRLLQGNTGGVLSEPLLDISSQSYLCFLKVAIPKRLDSSLINTITSSGCQRSPRLWIARGSYGRYYAHNAVESAPLGN